MKTRSMIRPNKTMTAPTFAHDPRAPRLKEPKQILMAFVLAVTLMVPHWTLAAGPAAVNLGTAGHFAILAGSAITDALNAGTVNGDVGLHPATGANITGLTAVQVNGIVYTIDAAGPTPRVIDPAGLNTAKNDLFAAFNTTAALPFPDVVYTAPGEIGGSNLVAGLYKFTSTAQITTGNLTLSGGPNDVWIFQIGTGLTVGNGIDVILSGGAQAQNVFWQVGTLATIGTSSDFKGTIMAGTSITLDTTSTLEGRALAYAQVTFDGASVSLATDYTVDKIVTSPPGGAAQVGESVTFQITVVNTGSVNLVTVPVEDRYSTSILSFVAPATPATVDTIDDGILNWANVGPLAPGASTNLFVTFTAVGSTAGQLATNVVVVSPTLLPPATLPAKTNMATYSTINPGYSIAKTLTSPLTHVPLVGEAVVFQITVANTGDVALATVPLEDQYSPAILSFVGATPTTVDNTDDGILNWANVGPLAVGASNNILVTFTVVGSTGGQSATNVVVASPPGLPAQTNTAIYSTTAAGTNGVGYTVSKTLSSPTNGAAQVGESVVFQITVVNTGTVTIAIMPVQDLYSTNILSFVGAVPPTVDTINDGILDWLNIGPLAPGASTNILVTFTVVAGTAGQTATNMVVAAPPGLPVQTSLVTFVTAAPGYSVVKTLTTPVSGVALVGDPVIFQITVANTGDVALLIVPVEDRYSISFLTFVGATPPTVDTINDGFLNWSNVGPLAPGATTNILVTFTAVAGTAGLPVTNTVVVSPPNLPAQTSTAPYSVNGALPTPVELKSFGAAHEGPDVLVTWATGVELENLGFNLYRATSAEGPRIKLNGSLIPGSGNSAGQNYQWRDTVLDPSATYYYWLEDVSSAFKTRTHGPAVARGTADSASTGGANTLAAFNVTAGGLYRIGWNALQSAQVRVAGLPASELQVNINGHPVATYVNAGGDTLAEGDSVLFYAPDMDVPQDCTLSLSTNAMAIELVFARPSRAAGDIQYASAGANQEVRFLATTNFVRYLLTDFTTSPVWVLDVSDAARCRLLYGFSYVAGDDGHMGVYLSYPGLTDTTFCLAVGDGSVHEVTILRRTP